MCWSGCPTQKWYLSMWYDFVTIVHNGFMENLPKNLPTLCPSQMALYWVIVWEIPLTNINLCKRDSDVVRVLRFSHWATSKTRLNVGKDFDQLLWTYIVGQVKLSWQKKQLDAHEFPKSRFNKKKNKNFCRNLAQPKYDAKWRVWFLVTTWQLQCFGAILKTCFIVMANHLVEICHL